jgi:hypothetical protein
MIGEPNAHELDALCFISKMESDLAKLRAEPELLTIERCRLNAIRWQNHAEWLVEAEKPARWEA